MAKRFEDDEKARLLSGLHHILPLGFLLRELYDMTEEETTQVLQELETETLSREASILAIKLAKMKKEYAYETGIETTKVI